MEAHKENIISIVDKDNNLIAIIRKTERCEIIYQVSKLDQDELMSLLNKIWQEKPVKS